MAIQVFIVEPNPALAVLLAGQKQVQVRGSAPSLQALPDQARAADLLLVSARLSAAEILDFIQGSEYPGRVVITEADESDHSLVALLEAGAAGYVSHGTSPAEVISTLQQIHSGELPLAPTVGTALVERMIELVALQQQRTDRALLENCPDLTTLTSREREILVLIRDGASNQDIAERLTIQLGTVKNHVHSILKKLNVTRRQQAASYVDLFDHTAPTMQA